SVSPELFDEPVVQLFRPLALQKLNDLLSSMRKLSAISPARVDSVSERNLFRIARIPAVFGQANLPNGSLTSERRQRRTRRDISLSFRFANRRLLIDHKHILMFTSRCRRTSRQPLRVRGVSSYHQRGDARSLFRDREITLRSPLDRKSVV